MGQVFGLGGEEDMRALEACIYTYSIYSKNTDVDYIVLFGTSYA
jgi:hypothetical protein